MTRLHKTHVGTYKFINWQGGWIWTIEQGGLITSYTWACWVWEIAGLSLRNCRSFYHSLQSIVLTNKEDLWKKLISTWLDLEILGSWPILSKCFPFVDLNHGLLPSMDNHFQQWSCFENKDPDFQCVVIFGLFMEWICQYPSPYPKKQS